MSTQGSVVPTQPPAAMAQANTSLAGNSRSSEAQGRPPSAPTYNAGGNAAPSLFGPAQGPRARDSSHQSPSLTTTETTTESSAEEVVDPVDDDHEKSVAVFVEGQYFDAGRKQEWSFEKLIECFKDANGAQHVQAIFLVVYRWKDEELERAEDKFSNVPWKYKGKGYVDAEDEDDIQRRKNIRKPLLTAIIPDRSKGIFDFPNLQSITITDRYADRALGLDEIGHGHHSGTVYAPNTMFNDYEASLIHEKSFYEASLLRTFVIMYLALADLTQSAIAPSIRRLSMEASKMDKVFRGLPLLKLNLSASAADSLRQGFSGVTELLLQVDAT